MEHKYKVGDKVIMHGVVDEVDREDDEAPYLIRFDNIDGKNDFDTVWANEKVLNVDIEKTYADGLMNAWELMKILVDMDMETIHEIFGDSYYNVLHKYSPKKALEKYLQYEEEKIFHVGDKVLCGGKAALVVHVHCPDIVDILFSDGSVEEDVSTAGLKKTGDKIDLTELFEKIKSSKPEETEWRW